MDPSFLPSVVWLNGAWLLAWFGITVWLSVTSTEAYVNVCVSLLFQLFSVFALLAYKTPKNRLANLVWFALFFAPVLFNVATMVRIFKITDSTTCNVCWQAIAALEITALSLSALALFWYISLNWTVSSEVTKVPKASMFARIICWANLAWLLLWFSVTVWLAATNATDAYVTVSMSLFFQLFSLYMLGTYQKATTVDPIGWSAAFLAPILFGVVSVVRITKTVDQVACYTCWQTLLGVASAGLGVSVLTIVWYFTTLPRGKSGASEAPLLPQKRAMYYSEDKGF